MSLIAKKMKTPVILDIDLDPMPDSFEHFGLDGINKIKVKDKVSVKIGDPSTPTYVHLGISLTELQALQTSTKRSRGGKRGNTSSATSSTPSTKSSGGFGSVPENPIASDKKAIKLAELKAEIEAEKGLTFKEKLLPYIEKVNENLAVLNIAPGDRMLIDREAKKQRSNWLRRTNNQIKKLEEEINGKK